MGDDRLVFVGIGVANPRGMQRLPGVYNSISGYLEWANSQGYDSSSITDESGTAVTAENIRELLTNALYRPAFRLVIAFVGHGFQNSTDQVWILSDGPNLNTGRISRDALRGSLRTMGYSRFR